ncbi:hypothetical protein [Clostridium sp. C8-1-8]|uniref:hypothetical protein n=1 Tax=Clostridium sp. C8-1-8 TaxID=2698831 RepID=UPI00136EBD71|nr:hypothetical protein [Clostridium sp. C8-1-8]
MSIKYRRLKWVSLSTALILIVIILISIGVYYINNNNTNLIKYEKGVNMDGISLNGENYSPVKVLSVDDKGKKVGYVADGNNKNLYDVYEIKGLKTSEWIAVNDSEEPGGRGIWACKKDSVELPKISDFGVNEIKILEDNEHYTKKTIKDSEEVNKIVDIITNSADEKKLSGPFDGKSYVLYFVSPQYKGIAYRGYLTITKDGKYYCRLAGDRYIEVTNEFGKYIK